MRIHQFYLFNVLWLFLVLNQFNYSCSEEDLSSEIEQRTTHRTSLEKMLQKAEGYAGFFISPFKPELNKSLNEESSDGGYGNVLNKFQNKIHAIVPGTRWCGDGNIAANDSDLGYFKNTDACCRQHDKCEFNIESGKSFQNLKNNGLFTRSACECDQAFYHCLKNARNRLATNIGHTYFNILRPQCIIYFYPIVSCEEHDGFILTKCIAYKCDMSQPKEYQWIDNPNF